MHTYIHTYVCAMSSSVCKRYKERSMYKQTSYSLKASRERTELLQHRFPRLSSRGKRVREKERERESFLVRNTEKDPFSRALTSDCEKRTEHESVSWGELRRRRSSPFFRFRFPPIFRRITRYSVSIRNLVPTCWPRFRRITRHEQHTRAERVPNVVVQLVRLWFYVEKRQ